MMTYSKVKEKEELEKVDGVDDHLEHQSFHHEA